MRFGWDPEKAQANLAKHGVSFELASRVWDDALYQTRFDRIVDGEERWQALGVVGSVTVLVVVHACPDEETVRIISARKAEPTERRRYEQETL